MKEFFDFVFEDGDVVFVRCDLGMVRLVFVVKGGELGFADFELLLEEFENVWRRGHGVGNADDVRDVPE